ncbi:UNVERIFIED_CONTAM: cytochrome [Sesamum calycinum]|uniref:Cytochrome n=1 Tax=Sesamum calycinum TaxID=2727403 RepID=A0AAW2RPY1_9LAMI
MFSYTFDGQEKPWQSKMVLLPFIFFTIFLIRKWFSSPKPSKNLPPSPPKLPIIGNLHQLGLNPHRILHSLALKYGPLMLLHLGSVPLLVVSSADAAREILKTHDPIFSNRPRSSVASGIYDCKDIAFSPYGRKYSDGEGGRKFKKVLETLGVLLGAFNVGEFIPWLVWIKYVDGMKGKIKKIAEDLDEFLEFVVKEHMDERRRNGNDGGGENRKDFVDVLLEIQRNEEGGFALDAISIKALILDMFAAGTDTTFTLIEWTLSELIRNKNVTMKLKNELKNIARSRSTITEEDLEKCAYLKAVVKETLRLHPPLPLLVPRESTQDVKLFNYDIAAGTRVVINVWL